MNFECKKKVYFSIVLSSRDLNQRNNIYIFFFLFSCFKANCNYIIWQIQKIKFKDSSLQPLKGLSCSYFSLFRYPYTSPTIWSLCTTPFTLFLFSPPQLCQIVHIQSLLTCIILAFTSHSLSNTQLWLGWVLNYSWREWSPHTPCMRDSFSQ